MKRMLIGIAALALSAGAVLAQDLVCYDMRAGGAPYPPGRAVATSATFYDGGAVAVAPGPVVVAEPAVAPVRRNWAWESCARLYPSFDPATGTFVGEDGLVHLCQ
ncbi:MULTISPECIES: BA14K family protein [unclassified Chelatococcus]|uniref:BA14K family protein n=1 Tax=unclassified Chelatococcus TaxID=2638111 RepID=UPI0003122F28|nr:MULTISPECIES: BA14K family protein [unclassified Chelatococcus]